MVHNTSFLRHKKASRQACGSDRTLKDKEIPLDSLRSADGSRTPGLCKELRPFSSYLGSTLSFFLREIASECTTPTPPKDRITRTRDRNGLSEHATRTHYTRAYGECMT